MSMPHEVEVGLARRREADLDLLVAHAHEQVEHDALALGAHRVDERLVAVAEVDGAPDRGAVDDLVGPGAVGQIDRELLVSTVGTGGPAVPRASGCSSWSLLFLKSGWCQPTTNSATREAVELDLVAAAKKEQAGEHGIRVALRYSDARPDVEERMRDATNSAGACRDRPASSYSPGAPAPDLPSVAWSSDRSPACRAARRRILPRRAGSTPTRIATRWSIATSRISSRSRRSTNGPEWKQLSPPTEPRRGMGRDPSGRRKRRQRGVRTMGVAAPATRRLSAPSASRMSRSTATPPPTSGCGWAAPTASTSRWHRVRRSWPGTTAPCARWRGTTICGVRGWWSGPAFTELLHPGFPADRRECWSGDYSEIACDEPHAAQVLLAFDGLSRRSAPT